MIVLDSLRKSYGDKQIFSSLSLEFMEHETTVIMGPSGLGKTTLFNILLDLEGYDGGRISGMDGKRVSAVFQEDRLLGHLSGLDNLLFVMPNARGHVQRARELMAAAALGDHIKKRAAQYSGGMKRRLALCRALMPPYDILLLDEPFKGLDWEVKAGIMAMLLTHAKGKTVIIITHDKEEAAFLGGRVIDLQMHL